MISPVQRKQPPPEYRSAIEANVLIDSAFDIIAQALRCRRCSFMLLDTTTGELRVGRAKGLTPEVIAQANARLGESIAGLVANQRKPLLISDLKAHPELRRSDGSYATDSFLSVPVLVRGQVCGVLNVADRLGDEPFDEHDLDTLTLFASHLSLCIDNSLLQAQIQRLANTDGLTGVYNHRYFQERLHEEIERAKRFGNAVSLLMIDVNEFKEFNDRYGHPAGDIVLKEIATIIRKRVRQFDLVSRYGGDEFTVTLPETDERRAQQVAARIARSVATHRFLHVPDESFPGLTVSIGVSTYPSPATYKQELIEQADRAMYSAKQGANPHLCHWQELLIRSAGGR